MERDRNLELSLLLIRLSTAAFLLVWVGQKLFHPAGAQGVFKTFYFLQPPETLVLAFGIVQLLIVLGFAAGWLRLWTYGAVLLMHTVSTLSTVGRLVDPYTRPNSLFWAAVPVLAAILALLLLRERDRMWSADAARTS